MEIERAGDLCAGSPRIRPCQHKHCIMWGIYKKLRITVDSFLLSLFFFLIVNPRNQEEGKHGGKADCMFSVLFLLITTSPCVSVAA